MECAGCLGGLYVSRIQEVQFCWKIFSWGEFGFSVDKIKIPRIDHYVIIEISQDIFETTSAVIQGERCCLKIDMGAHSSYCYSVLCNHNHDNGKFKIWSINLSMK